METNDRPAVELTDSLLVTGSVIIARRNNGKLYAVEPYTREELQAIVQQAHDAYGITADPFATPGSADDQPAPHGAQCGDPCRHDAECPHGKAWTEGETCAACVPAGVLA